MAAFDPLRNRVLRFLRVPLEPQPPAGAAGSVRVFRAGRNFYKLKLLGWGIGQVGALVGIVFSLGFINQIEREVDRYREARRTQAVTQARERAAARENAAQPTPPEHPPAAAEASLTPTAPSPGPPATASEAKSESAEPRAKAKGPRRGGKQGSRDGLGRIIDRSPWWVLPAIQVLEYLGVLGYLLQIPITYAMVRLDWEQRWYIVTDRSLRIRTGLNTVLESTMSFANIQQVVVTQGPLQRFLGLADVHVQSAGGGSTTEHHPAAERSLHAGVFHGVERATEIRDLILERLRLFRQAGLGDPDDPNAAAVSLVGTPAPSPAEAHAAAGELLAEARALRATLATT